MKRSLHYTLQTRRQRGSMIIIQASALMLIALILLMAVPMVRDRLSDHQENDKCVLQGR